LKINWILPDLASGGIGGIPACSWQEAGEY
jgi:hypothetical protein